MRGLTSDVAPEPAHLREKDQCLDAQFGGSGVPGTGLDGTAGEHRDHPLSPGPAAGRLAASQTLDHQSRSGLRQEKKRRDALIALAKLCGWVVGYADEVWWSRVAQPKMHSWSEAGEPRRLVGRQTSKEDTDPQALRCFGLLQTDPQTSPPRFVDGRP